MKRMHVHVSVEDIAKAIGFYSALFAAKPTVVKARLREMDARRSARELRDLDARARARPRSSRHPGRGPDELHEVYARLRKRGRPVARARRTTCCYAQSEKSWVDDPAGISWETFLTPARARTTATSVERDAQIAHHKAVLRRRSGPNAETSHIGLLRGGESWPTVLTTSCFFAPAIRRARSSPRRS